MRDISLSDFVRVTYKLAEHGDKITYLGICPMSKEIIKISIELAIEYDFPLLFVASRNQISEDEGGGYVMGLTPESFLQKVQDMEESLGISSNSKHRYLRFVGVDHCGPWYKEHEKSLGEKEAIEAVKCSLSACLKAGYRVFHIDCSFKPPHHVLVDEAKRIQLTADLFEFTERERIRLGKSRVSYEIGTEETAGASISTGHFKKSINEILLELKKRKLPEPVFVVGRTGAKIEMLENVGGFDYTAASSLPQIAKEFGLGFKEHNADYLSALILSLHPEYGITCANVGPSFAAAQTRALLDLTDLEEKKITKGRANLYNIMSQVVLEKAPFGKWLRKGDEWTVARLREMPAELRAVTVVAGHYVYYDEKVKRVITKLYNNLRKSNILESPESCVISAIRKAIMRYIDAFNLQGSTSKILRAM